MPKDDIFALHVRVGNEILHEVCDEKSDIYVGWNPNSNTTKHEKIVSKDGTSQGYPLTPYDIFIETFDRHLTLWFDVYIDGQKVSSRPIIGAKKLFIDGMYFNGVQRAFTFSLPIITENKEERLPDVVDQTSIGTIKADVFSAKTLPGVFIPRASSKPRAYHQSTKNDNHPGVCTALVDKTKNSSRGNFPPRPRPRLAADRFLSSLKLSYRPISDIQHLFSPSTIEKSEIKEDSTHKDAAPNGSRNNNLPGSAPGVSSKSVNPSWDTGLIIGQPCLSSTPVSVRGTTSATNGSQTNEDNIKLSHSVMGSDTYADVNINCNNLCTSNKVIKTRYSMDKPNINEIAHDLNKDSSNPPIAEQPCVLSTVEPITNHADLLCKIEQESPAVNSDQATLSNLISDYAKLHRKSMNKPDAEQLNNIIEEKESIPLLTKTITPPKRALDKTSSDFIPLNKKMKLSVSQTILTPVKPKVQSSPQPVTQKHKATIKTANTADTSLIILDSDSDSDDSVIWYGDDSCHFIDVDPEPATVIHITDDESRDDTFDL